MTPTIEDFLRLIEELAPSELAEDWDNPGLQAGGFSGPIERVLLSLDPTPGSIESARRQGAQVLFTHHPLLFRPVTRVHIGSYPGNVLREAIKSEISIVAAHTNLDAACGGINDILAELLEIEGAEVLQDGKDARKTGIGRIGLLSAPLPLTGLLARIREKLGIGRAGVVGDPDAEVRRVAVVGGSGGSCLPACARKGADCVVTGDVGHHHALEAKALGMSLIDAGHYGLEQTAFRVFGGRLERLMREREWRIEVIAYDDERDPIRWLT